MTDFAEKYPWTKVTMNRVEPWRAIGSGWFDDIDDWCPGWMKIIEDAAIRVQSIIDAHPGCTYEIQQFKEKLGSIRLYMTCSQDVNALIYDVVRELEILSMHTCMSCGAEAKLRDIRFYTVCFCDKCTNRANKI